MTPIPSRNQWWISPDPFRIALLGFPAPPEPPAARVGVADNAGASTWRKEGERCQQWPVVDTDRCEGSQTSSKSVASRER